MTAPTVGSRLRVSSFGVPIGPSSPNRTKQTACRSSWPRTPLSVATGTCTARRRYDGRIWPGARDLADDGQQRRATEARFRLRLRGRHRPTRQPVVGAVGPGCVGRGASSPPVVYDRQLAPCSRTSARTETFTRPHTRMANRRPRPQRNGVSAPLRDSQCAQHVPKGRRNISMVNVRHLRASDSPGDVAPGLIGSSPPRTNRTPTSRRP